MKPIIRCLALLGTLTLTLVGLSSAPPAEAKAIEGVVAELGSAAKPVAAVTDAAGAVYLLNEGDATVSKIAPTGDVTRVFASLGRSAVPQALTIDPAGYLYVACAGTDSVTRISPAGTVVSYWAYDGVGSMPRAITSDAAGNVFASNWGTSTITKITAGGAVVPVFARLDPADRPLGIATDSAGSVYVAETQTGHLSKVAATGVLQESFAERPRGAGSPSAPVPGPLAVAVGSRGVVYAVYSDGTLSSFAADGSVLTAKVVLTAGAHRPTGVLLDAFGDAFVGDELSHAVTALDGAGGPATSISDFGAGSIVRAVALSAHGLFAADYVSGSVRRVELSPAITSSPVVSALRRGTPTALDVSFTGFGTRLIVSVGVLPPGLTLDESTGRLSGTPTTAGTFAFDIVAGSHWGATPAQHEVLTVGR